MSDHPILYSGPMIRALLEGRKTQTRRVVKPQPPVGHVYVGRVLCSTHRADEGKWTWAVEQAAMLRDAHRVRCPYGQPGDLLWVRETFRGARGYDGMPPSKWGNKPIWYSADGDPDAQRWWHLSDRGKPGIHMPRWASRLTLRITDVRVERLQNISEADAIAEGISPKWEPGCSGRLMEAIGGFSFRPAASAYADLWESINGPGSWDANPWVWAISFDVIKANIDQVKP